MTKEFLKQVMSIPSCSRKEDMMIEFVEKWAKENGVKCSKDSKGNLFLTKGSAKIYPSLTAHLDTVQTKQGEYVDQHKLLDIIEDGDSLKCDGFGIGADDKGGVAIALDVLSRASACKCALFIGEEIGMVGSRAADMSFFDDCAYCIGLDSPEYNRAAYACSGTRIHSEEFFNEFVKEICAKHGVTNFKSEPWTDCLEIRKRTKMECMNFGNGGWNPHSSTEYIKVSENIKASDMVMDLVKSIPLDKLYRSEPTEEKMSWWSSDDDEDEGIDIDNIDPKANCSIALEFDDEEQLQEFIEKLAEKNIAVESDEDGFNSTTLTGKIEAIKQAYMLFVSIIYGEEINTWDDIDLFSLQDFEQGIVVDGETPDADDDKEEDPDAQFWKDLGF